MRISVPGMQLADGSGRAGSMASSGTTWVPGDSSVMPYACPTGGRPSRCEQAAASSASSGAAALTMYSRDDRS